MTLKFTDSNFKTEVLESDKPVLVDFYAGWCGPCKMMAPIVSELADEYQGTLKIGKINVDEESQTAETYRVMTIPTLIIIKDGKPVETVVGVVSKKALQDKLNEYK